MPPTSLSLSKPPDPYCQIAGGNACHARERITGFWGSDVGVVGAGVPPSARRLRLSIPPRVPGSVPGAPAGSVALGADRGPLPGARAAVRSSTSFSGPYLASLSRSAHPAPQRGSGLLRTAPPLPLLTRPHQPPEIVVLQTPDCIPGNRKLSPHIFQFCVFLPMIRILSHLADCFLTTGFLCAASFGTRQASVTQGSMCLCENGQSPYIGRNRQNFSFTSKMCD